MQCCGSGSYCGGNLINLPTGTDQFRILTIYQRFRENKLKKKVLMATKMSR
jgi:hypothetical protein